ncbi:hypothetical protein C8J57DRAFT_1508786 [Mycena rebaudengoi]|nr:hypothetical protein C8J57DRAFT_1508786 [Mycena rebaudengoi]
MLLASAAMANIPSVPLPVTAVPSKEKKRKANGENEGADGPKKRLKKDAKVEDTAEVMAQLKELFKHATLGPEALKHRQEAAAAHNPAFERYQGTYSIIADPDTDNKARARRVARDLKECTTLDFVLEDRLKSVRSSGASKAYTIWYKCMCGAASTGLKRRPSDLSAWLMNKKNPDVSMGEGPSDCAGRVEISAEDDVSHRLGILGQRVKVTVNHPRRG